MFDLSANPALHRSPIAPNPPTNLPELFPGHPGTFIPISRKRCSSFLLPAKSPIVCVSSPTIFSPSVRKNRWGGNRPIRWWFCCWCILIPVGFWVGGRNWGSWSRVCSLIVCIGFGWCRLTGAELRRKIGNSGRRKLDFRYLFLINSIRLEFFYFRFLV